MNTHNMNLKWKFYSIVQDMIGSKNKSSKSLLMKSINQLKVTLSFLIATTISFFASAQHEFGVKLGYEIPVDKISWVYKPTTSFSFQYSKMKSKYKGRMRSIDFGLGYFKYNTKADKFYYLLDNNAYGTASFSSYSVLQLKFFGIRSIRKLNDRMEFYFGGHCSYYYVKYTVDQVEPLSTINASQIEGKGALTPNIGVNYLFGDKFGATFHSEYSMYFPLGDLAEVNDFGSFGTVNFLFSLRLGVFIRID